MFTAELRRRYFEWRSYSFQAIGDVIIWAIVLPIMLVMFENVSRDSGVVYTVNQQAASIIGFVMWRFCMAALAKLPRGVKDEADVGTLENVMVSTQVPPFWVFFYRGVVISIQAAVEAVVIGLVLVLIFGVALPTSVLALFIAVITVLGTIGCGLALAGVALVYKVVDQLAYIISILALFISGAAVPLNTLGSAFTVLKVAFPTALGIDLLRSELLSSEVNLLAILGLLGQSLVFLGIGFVVFQWGLKKAKRNALMATY